MSDGFNIKIDVGSFDDVMTTLQLLKSLLPTNAATTITECVEQTKDQVVYETVKVLNVDDERVNSEITVEQTPEDALKDYRAVIISKGKPIEMIDLAIDAAGWDWRNPKPINIQIFRNGATHEFRHVFVAKNHIYGRKKSDGTSAGNRVFAWMKYVAKAQELRYPIERLQTVRVQDIQAQPEFIDPVTEDGADAVIENYKTAVDEILANV